MNRTLKIWWRKLVIIAKGIFHWFYPYPIFEEEPMEFRFVNIRRPKVRYDIKHSFFSFTIKTKDDGFKYAFFILMLALFFFDAVFQSQCWHFHT